MSEVTQPTLNERARALATRTDVLREWGIVVALIVVSLGFSIAKPEFHSWDNVTTILGAVSIVGIMAVCSTFVILTGGIDLSVGAIITLSGLAASWALTSSGWSIVPAMGLGVLVGAIAGLGSGILIAVFELPPIIVTLATMTLVRNIAHLLNHAELHAVDRPGSYLYLGGGKLLGLPFQVWIFALVAGVAILIQSRTRLGFSTYAVGENATAARLSGLPIWRTKVLVYVISGIGAAIAGMILSSEVHTATSTYGVGYELDVIAGVVVGGTSLFGGIGSVQRSVLGVLLIGVINDGLNILNVPAADFQIVKGAIIVVACGLDQYLRRTER